MYYNVVVNSDRGYKCYDVTDRENIFRGYTVPGEFYTREYDGYYSPVRNKKSEFIIKKTTVKPSIYKRDWPYCRKNEYKYAFTERTSRVITTDKDVYYNAHKDRFISKYSTSTKTRTEYDLPHYIVF